MSLDALIHRMKQGLADPDTRPLWLHWSDIALLEDLRDELAQDDQRIETLRTALSAAIDQALRDKPTRSEMSEIDWKTAQFVWSDPSSKDS